MLSQMASNPGVPPDTLRMNVAPSSTAIVTARRLLLLLLANAKLKKPHWVGLPFRKQCCIAVKAHRDWHDDWSITAFDRGRICLHGKEKGDRSACLRTGEVLVVPPITLSVSGGTTSVTVTSGNKKELSEEQVHIAVQQRTGGVIPNFYSTYDWNAPPMLAKQKFQLSIRSIIDPVSFLTVSGIAGAEQYEGIFPAYGSGIEGYGKRYGAALANHISGTLLGRAVYPLIFHQDPRCFYKGKGSIQSRLLAAGCTDFGEPASFRGCRESLEKQFQT